MDDIISTKHCLICNVGRDTVYWHFPDDGDMWCYCNRCDRGYSIYDYTRRAGLSLKDFLMLDFTFEENKPNEVQKMDWPKSFLPMFDKRSAAGVEYLKSRGLEVDDAMFYDISRKGIVFPYYYYGVFTGAQIRLLEPWTDENGKMHKMSALAGTRTSLLIFNWDQQPFRQPYKAMVVCEGALNCFSIQQSLNKMYGGASNNPFKTIACSGSSMSQHHLETLKGLKDQGLRIISALDTDEKGLKGLKELHTAEAITHYAITDDTTLDWNDKIRELGFEAFATYFLSTIKKI